MRIILIICFLLTPMAAWAWPGTVVAVHDGDTLRVRNDAGKVVKVRIYGVDCPEMAQNYGAAARDMTRAMLLDKVVQVIPVTTDRYARTVAGIIVLDDMMILQDSLISAGLAWVDDRYCRIPACDLWRMHQADARAAHPPRGLWSDDDPTPPWAWRRAQKGVRHVR